MAFRGPVDNSHLSDKFIISGHQRPVYREVTTVYNSQMSAGFCLVSGIREIWFVEYILIKFKEKNGTE